MSLHDTKTEYDLTSVPALDEEFSLEEILAEFGKGREQKALQEAEQSASETVKPSVPAVEQPDPEPVLQKPLEEEPVPVDSEAAAEPKLPEPAVKPEELPVAPRPISLEEVPVE